MSKLSVKYCDPENQEQFYFFTRDVECKKVLVYQNGRVIKTINDISDFEKGITFIDQENNKVSARLLNRNKFQISVSVDGNIYEVENKTENVNVKLLGWLFVVVLIVQLMNIMYFRDNDSLVRTDYWSDVLFPLYFPLTMTIPVIIYTLTAVVLFTNRAWSYFLGFAVLIAFTSIEIYQYFLLTSKWNIEYPTIIQVSIVIRVLVALCLMLGLVLIIWKWRAKRL